MEIENMNDQSIVLGYSYQSMNFCLDCTTYVIIYTGAQLSGSGAQLSGSGAQLSGSGAQLSAISAYIHTSYLGAQLSASPYICYSHLYI